MLEGPFHLVHLMMIVRPACRTCPALRGVESRPTMFCLSRDATTGNRANGVFMNLPGRSVDEKHEL